jgi:hypothetical protein
VKLIVLAEDKFWGQFLSATYGKPVQKRLYGRAPRYTTIPVDDEAVSRLMQPIPWDDYPHLAEHRDQHVDDGPHREINAFDVGLDLILAGLQRRTAFLRTDRCSRCPSECFSFVVWL